MQRVIMNRKSSQWSKITAVVPQRSVLESPFFLVYVNGFVDNISADVRLSANDIVAADQLNRNLTTISDRAYQWKMQFNPDKTKHFFKSFFHKRK